MPYRHLDPDERTEKMAADWNSNAERIAILETRYAHSLEKLDEQSEQLRAIQQQVKEMHDLLMQAKGARWAIIAVAGAAGFASGKLGALVLTFLGMKLP